MSMHRRWLFSAAGKSVMAAALGAIAKAAAAPPNGNNTATSALLTLTPIPDVWPAKPDDALTELTKVFDEGVMDWENPTRRHWGLNPASATPPLALSKVSPHALAVYKTRLISNYPSHGSYRLLLEQAAVMGFLTRCMWQLEGGPADTLGAVHLHSAREAFGFAVSSRFQGRYCNLVIKDDPNGIRTMSPQLDKACALC
jgi:hypothetical protein